jgi:hypothetical protein
MRGGLLRGTRVWVSGSATSSALAHQIALADPAASAGHQQCLETLQGALARFTTAQFGRDEKLDDAALGESLTDGFTVLRRLKFENLWVMRKLKSATGFAAELGNRAWSR